jgi:AraC-like DNA-binding protein
MARAASIVAEMNGSMDGADSVTDMARIQLSCGSFDALRAVHFVRRFPPHFHDTFAIGVVESGLTRIRTRRGEWIGGPGTILAFSPGEIHSAEPVTEAGYTFRMVYPPNECIREIGVGRLRAEIGTPLFCQPVIENARLGRQFRDAHARLTDEMSVTRAESRLLATLRALVHGNGTRAAAGDDEPADTDVEVVRRAQDFLHERYAERLRLSALADTCHLSPFQMIRVFHRVLGVPPFAYLVQIRVNRAQTMLREGSSLADAAYSCGFSDQSHLTRMFKRAVGVPPGQYVRSVRRTAA